MKLKKLSIAAIVFSFSCASFSSISYASENQTEELQNFVTKYYHVVDSSVGNLSLDSNLSDFFSTKDNLDYQVIDTIIQHRKAQISDLHYSDFTTNLNFKSINKDNDTYSVIVEKNTDVYFKCMNGESSKIEEEHTLTIKALDNNSFQIVSDDYSDDIREAIKEKYIQKRNLLQAKKQLLSETQDSVAEQKNFIRVLKTESLTNDIFNTPAPKLTAAAKFKFKAYNREAARNYAYKYVLSPNRDYANFEKEGGNCTNFTSQCLKAGGIQQDYTGNYQWYYTSSSKRAPAWTSANSFRTYYKKNVGSSSVKGLKASTSSFKDMRLGDLVQLVSSGKATHTMFISSPIYDNWASKDPWKYKHDVGICQNSTGASSRLKNVPLSTKPKNREYIHITGSYS